MMVLPIRQVDSTSVDASRRILLTKCDDKRSYNARTGEKWEECTSCSPQKAALIEHAAQHDR
jgi:hypothetical protein